MSWHATLLEPCITYVDFKGWGCNTCSMKTWGLFFDHKWKFWAFTYLSECTHTSSVKNMVPRMCIPPWMKFWNQWQKQVIFCNRVVLIIDRRICGRGGGVNHAMYSVPMILVCKLWQVDHCVAHCLSNVRSKTDPSLLILSYESHLFIKPFVILILSHSILFHLQVTCYSVHVYF